MKNKNSSKFSGFTLIELLVVVLIIGILAAIALPQYQKAVWKSRLSEVAIQANAYMKGVDLWLMENGGFPSSNVQFTGTRKNADLAVSVPCVSEDVEWCYTKLGQWMVTGGGGSCNLTFFSTLPSFNVFVIWEKSGTGGWRETILFANNQAEICRWVIGIYGKESLDGMAADDCGAYL